MKNWCFKQLINKHVDYLSKQQQQQQKQKNVA